jgi:hypothetical protein
MTRTTFHWREVKNSKPLQFLLGILMDASRPMTGMEIQLEAERRGGWVANPATGIGEIGQNPGYRVSDGAAFKQKSGPAVRFPDGKYRYWLIAAPGWRQSWTVDGEFQVRSAECEVNRVRSAECGVRSEPNAECGVRIAENETAEPRRCGNPVCGRPIPEDGEPWCPGSEVCKKEYFKGLQRKLF